MRVKYTIYNMGIWLVCVYKPIHHIHCSTFHQNSVARTEGYVGVSRHPRITMGGAYCDRGDIKGDEQ